ncbi:MAG: hypothetical protein ACYCVT_09435 [Acidithiobacillus ferrooxidans]|uniref:hypothetical protein n=1 Tax=Acidithiobacillus ferriphilus TaxID=1689834 RepID=UPI002DC0358F|nr:hypothetical protein [Acidithiobacillus ferriphilus]MEB8476601.1 hypothetical protein [Acidithiobacillus ferriphilus]
MMTPNSKEEHRAFKQWCNTSDDLLVEAAHAVNAASSVSRLAAIQNLDDAADDYWCGDSEIDDA